MMSTENIVIYRLGSLGDMIVALPCLHFIADRFPKATRYLLTNFPAHQKASMAEEILDHTGLIHHYIQYPLKTRRLSVFLKLRHTLRDLKPAHFIYITESRGLLKAWRDYFFFRFFCGLSRVVGVPYTLDLSRHRYDKIAKRYEPEYHRLARCLNRLGRVDIESSSVWSLALTDLEKKEVAGKLLGANIAKPFIVCSLGTKCDVKHWGLDYWEKLIQSLSEKNERYGLVFVGVASEYEESEKLKSLWEGATLNLCGQMSLRQTAAVMSQARLFIGHDSGPMHLAAVFGVPCVAIFSARALPGIWFPFGKQHQILYHRVSCAGCQLDVCVKYQKKCIRSILPDEVERAARKILSEADGAAT